MNEHDLMAKYQTFEKEVTVKVRSEQDWQRFLRDFGYCDGPPREIGEVMAEHFGTPRSFINGVDTVLNYATERDYLRRHPHCNGEGYQVGLKVGERIRRSWT